MTHFLDQPVRLREMKREREVTFRSQAGFLGLWGKLGREDFETVLGIHLFLVVIVKYLFIYLAVVGFSCCMWDHQHLLQHANSVMACGI